MIGDNEGPYGRLTDESSERYHSNAAVGSTKLKDFISNERLLSGRYITGEIPHEETEAMREGTALHCAVLEPERFEAEYVVSPKFDRRTKVGKADSAAFAAANAGKRVLDAEQWELVRQMAQAIDDNQDARDLLSGAENEVTYRHWAEEYGLSLQCRVDADRPDCLIDIKRTADIGKFRRTGVIDFGYDIQRALYDFVKRSVMGGPTLPFYFIAVEPVAPFEVGVFDMDDAFLNIGWSKVDAGLRRLRYCLDHNEFRRDQVGIQRLVAPRWYVEGAEATSY